MESVKDKPLEQKFFTYRRLFGSMYNSYSMFDETLKPFKEAEKKKLMHDLANVLSERRAQLECN